MEGRMTFTIIKPDAVEKSCIGQIIAKITEAGFRIVALRMLQLSRAQAEEFYAVHKGRDFYEKLIEFMISGPIVVIALEKANAVQEFRTLIGATNSADAKEGTIRKMYGTDGRRNAVHGSDSDENALREMQFFFAPDQIFMP